MIMVRKEVRVKKLVGLGERRDLKTHSKDEQNTRFF